MITKNKLKSEKRIKCFACKKPIHIDELGGVMKLKGKEAWFHGNIVCLVEVNLQSK